MKQLQLIDLVVKRVEAYFVYLTDMVEEEQLILSQEICID